MSLTSFGLCRQTVHGEQKGDGSAGSERGGMKGGVEPMSVQVQVLVDDYLGERTLHTVTYHQQ